MQEEICRWLTEWFSNKGKLTGSSGPEVQSINYFDAGWLTSLEVIEFVTEIENKFGVQFAEEDFHDQRFTTISGLSQLIRERSAPQVGDHR